MIDATGAAGEWTSATIKRTRLKGLQMLAEKQKRSVSAQLDLILEEAGIKEVSLEEEATA